MEYNLISDSLGYRVGPNVDLMKAKEGAIVGWFLRYRWQPIRSPQKEWGSHRPEEGLIVGGSLAMEGATIPRARNGRL